MLNRIHVLLPAFVLTAVPIQNPCDGFVHDPKGYEMIFGMLIIICQAEFCQSLIEKHNSTADRLDVQT